MIKTNIFILMAVAMLMSACGKTSGDANNNGKNAKSADSTALRVAVMPTLDCLPLFVASERGFFEHQGVNVRLIPFQSQTDQDQALLKGRVDGLVTDLVKAERLQQHDALPLRFVSATAASWQLLTNASAKIYDVSQLKNKMIAIAQFSADDLLADEVMAEASLDSSSVFKVKFNNLTVRLDMLKNNIMDALVLPEPQATEARLLKSRVLFDSRKADIRLGVIAFREQTMHNSTRQFQVESFLRSYDEACDSLNKYGVRAYGAIIRQYCGVSQVAVDSLSQFHFEHAAPPRPADVERARNWNMYNR